MTLDLTVSGSQGRAPPGLVLQLPGPYVRATGAPLVDVELLEDVEAVEETAGDLLLFDCYFSDPFPKGARKVVGVFNTNWGLENGQTSKPVLDTK